MLDVQPERSVRARVRGRRVRMRERESVECILSGDMTLLRLKQRMMLMVEEMKIGNDKT